MKSISRVKKEKQARTLILSAFLLVALPAWSQDIGNGGGDDNSGGNVSSPAEIRAGLRNDATTNILDGFTSYLNAKCLPDHLLSGEESVDSQNEANKIENCVMKELKLVLPKKGAAAVKGFFNVKPKDLKNAAQDVIDNNQFDDSGSGDDSAN